MGRAGGREEGAAGWDVLGVGGFIKALAVPPAILCIVYLVVALTNDLGGKE